MLPKAYLTSHSRMSGSRWVTTPSWLSGSWRPFSYSSSVYSCGHLFLVSSASVGFLNPVYPLLCTSLYEIPLIFLNRFLSFQFYCFPVSLHCSLKNAFLSLLAFLWSSAFSWVYLSLSPLPFISLLSSATCKASSDNHFAFLHFFFLGMVLVTTSYTMLQTSVHSSSGTLSARSNPLNLFVTSSVLS